MEWGLGQLSAALTWVCRSSSPQGLMLEVTFMVFPATLAIYGIVPISPFLFQNLFFSDISKAPIVLFCMELLHGISLTIPLLSIYSYLDLM